MVKWYILKIKTGKMTIDEVPKKWHDKVKEEIEGESESRE